MLYSASDFKKYTSYEGIYFERNYVASIKLINSSTTSQEETIAHDFQCLILCNYDNDLNANIDDKNKLNISSSNCKLEEDIIISPGYISWCLIFNQKKISEIHEKFENLKNNIHIGMPHIDDYYLICRDTIYGSMSQRRRRPIV